jgi:hypothetical protein
VTRIENADVERVTGIEPAWPAWKAELGGFTEAVSSLMKIPFWASF